MKKIIPILTLFSITILAAATSCKPAVSDRPEFAILEKTDTIARNGGNLELAYHLEYISKYSNDAVMRHIQQTQLFDFFGSEFVRTDPAGSAKAFEEGTAGNFKTDTIGNRGGFLKLNSRSGVIGDRIVTFSVERAEYSGGAHGLETTTFTNFDLRNGARLSLDDIFSPEGKAALGDMIRAQIMKDNGAATWDQLIEKRCFHAAGEVIPTDNFLLTATDITFAYNPYEIACYAVGGTKVTIPLAGLAGFKNEMLKK